MTATVPAAGVRVFSTGLLHTTVTPHPDGGWTWRRRPGEQAPTPFVPADSVPGGLFAPVEAPERVRWVVGVPDGAAREYHLRGADSAASLVLRHGPGGDLPAVLRALGRGLRELHALPVPADVRLDRRPRGLTRFTGWLAGRAPNPRAAYAESLLRVRLGDARLNTLRALCDRIAGADEVTLCHGAPGLGSLVPADAPGRADALIGEDLCLAPWYVDLGWILGELVELRWYLGGDRQAWTEMVDALFQGYGRDLGDRWPELAAYRVLLHLHDYTAYVGWDRDVFERYTGFATYLLSLRP